MTTGRYLEQQKPDSGIEREMVWLPPTYRNIEGDDLVALFYEGPFLHRYSFIFYSCILISSGNEIGPLTTVEVSLSHKAWLASCFIILGLILTGVILGNIAEAIESMNEQETTYDRQVDEMQLKLKQNKVPDDVQEKVMLYMNYCHQEEVQFNEPQESFAYVAKSLRQKILLQEFDKISQSVPLFSRLTPSEFYELFSRFR